MYLKSVWCNFHGKLDQRSGGRCWHQRQHGGMLHGDQHKGCKTRTWRHLRFWNEALLSFQHILCHNIQQLCLSCNLPQITDAVTLQTSALEVLGSRPWYTLSWLRCFDDSISIFRKMSGCYSDVNKHYLHTNPRIQFTTIYPPLFINFHSPKSSIFFNISRVIRSKSTFRRNMSLYLQSCLIPAAWWFPDQSNLRP